MKIKVYVYQNGVIIHIFKNRCALVVQDRTQVDQSLDRYNRYGINLSTATTRLRLFVSGLRCVPIVKSAAAA